MLTLVIGDKRYSSWSLRAWLALRQTGKPFREIRLPLFTPEFEKKIKKYSPGGKVPCLKDGKTVVWESLAICEYLAERFPAAGLWPKNAKARAHARALSFRPLFNRRRHVRGRGHPLCHLRRQSRPGFKALHGCHPGPARHAGMDSRRQIRKRNRQPLIAKRQALLILALLAAFPLTARAEDKPPHYDEVMRSEEHTSEL